MRDGDGILRMAKVAGEEGGMDPTVLDWCMNVREMATRRESTRG